MNAGLAAKDRLFLAALILVWAASWPIMKVGVAAVPPIWFALLRYAIGATLLFVVVASRGKVEAPVRHDWPLVLVSGALQMACYSAFTGLALTLLPPGRAAVLAYSTPLWVLPLGAWRLKERVSSEQCVGVALGVLGIAIIAWPSLQAHSGEQLIAYGLLLAAAGFWAISIVHVRGHKFVGTALALAPWQMLVAAALLLPVAIATEGPLLRLNATGLIALAYVGPIATAFAYWAIVDLGSRLSATTLSMALLATPSLGIMISAAALGEIIDRPLVAGAAAIAAGIGLTIRRSAKRKP
ncbi:DMT family transporter [Sphingomonas alba]|uniref:DMT family transporter n=1 Tax=Sphingomonas alba TaxID=2908208 RepID=A0ABT0RPS5_9SPHN|nr:DMT family transporter [Sphingomonas alba]MCL6684653.1 DMT family transporter [Sphingomonas alba]